MNDIMEGERLAAEGSKAAYDHAHADWKEAAAWAVKSLAFERETFDADDVWERLESWGDWTPEPRALGVVIRQAVALGHIELTGQYVKSRRPVCHRKPTQVYRSLRWVA